MPNHRPDNRDAFTEINLEQVDPAACLKHLNAGISRSPSELTPVRPVLEFSMVDPRFITETDTLGELDDRPNLMELTPQQFESLIQNLFDAIGLDTRQTRPSRDGGVDCVAYNTDPILGGKVVIQAKRYKHIVGVSAVRDLYGTLQNEGASRASSSRRAGTAKHHLSSLRANPLSCSTAPTFFPHLSRNPCGDQGSDRAARRLARSSTRLGRDTGVVVLGCELARFRGRWASRPVVF